MKSNLTPLKGSYPEQDCLFLLQEISQEFKSVEEKEKLIQSGQMHYSETISQESEPTKEYTELFLSMNKKYKSRLASEVMRLAEIAIQARPSFGSTEKPIVILSLARAGTPIGVMLKKALSIKGVESVHYAISIIRDKGIDEEALKYVLDRFDAESICFVDGWTAKGVITRELHSTVESFNKLNNTKVPKELFVVSDIGGTADYAATYSDYTMPSALMNSTISGLTSRSILNDKVTGGFHGCVVYRHLSHCDYSNWFIDQIVAEMNVDNMCPEEEVSKEHRMKMTKNFLDSIQKEFGVGDINRIKPGIAEATRVMLRRVPDMLIVRSEKDNDVKHLIQIAQEKNITIIVREDMPFGACSLIKDVL